MGFTHYWSVDRRVPEWPRVFGMTAFDAQRIFAELESGDWRPELPAEGPNTAERFDFRLAPDEFAVEEGLIWLEQPDEGGTFQIEINDPDSEQFAFQHMGYPPGVSWEHCKTNRARYDLAAMAVLLRLWHHAVLESPLWHSCCVGLASDGEWDGSVFENGLWVEWIPARQLVDHIFGCTMTQLQTTPLQDQLPVLAPTVPSRIKERP